MNNLYYLNGGFDLSLTGQDTDRYRTLLQEMTLWMTLYAETGDYCVVTANGISPEYHKYLAAIGLDTGQIISPDMRPGPLQGRAWGWDHEAVHALSAYGAHCEHPDFSAVKKANSRSGHLPVFLSVNTDFQGANVCSSPDECRMYLKSCTQYPVVIKPDFSNTGIGFVHITDHSRVEKSMARIKRLFGGTNSKVLVMPWLKRIKDISTRFFLDGQGRISHLKQTEALVTRGGSSYGFLLEYDGLDTGPWSERLDSMLRETVRWLHGLGYYGPVSLDSFVYDDAGTLRCAAGIDCNARYSVGFIAQRIFDKLGSRAACVRTVGNRKAQFPVSYEELSRLLGDLAYDRAAGRGVAVLTPLRYVCNRKERHPERTMIAICGHTREEVLELDRNITELIRK